MKRLQYNNSFFHYSSLMQNKLDILLVCNNRLRPYPFSGTVSRYDRYMYIIDLMRIREVFWNIRCNLEADLSELQEKLNLLSGVFVFTS